LRFILNKKPRFFCDNCGYEVGADVKTCPYCGRHFASIRCPACDYSGPDKMFQNGCPMCGYSSTPSSKTGKAYKSREKKPRRPAESLPTWALILSVLALFVVIWLFSWLITR
jgi:uncharacterized membrane protein YvbJ